MVHEIWNANKGKSSLQALACLCDLKFIADRFEMVFIQEMVCLCLHRILNKFLCNNILLKWFFFSYNISPISTLFRGVSIGMLFFIKEFINKLHIFVRLQFLIHYSTRKYKCKHQNYISFIFLEFSNELNITARTV